MPDRFHADDVAIFAAGGVPVFSWFVEFWPGAFYNVQTTVTDKVIRIDGISMRLHNLDAGEDTKLHYPPVRITVVNDDAFDPGFWYPDARAVKRSKFILQLSTPASGKIFDLWAAVQSYQLNDDNTITFDCEHPLVEWGRRTIREGDAAKASSVVIPV